jgi:hypothetical protein
LNTVGRFIYTKYRGKMYVWALWEDLFKHNTEEYCMLNTVGRFIYTKYWGMLYVEHCGKIYLLKILRNTVCWALWEDLITQNTEEYTVCWALWEDLFTQDTEEYFMLNTVGRFIYSKYWGILYVEHCGKIYLLKILRNTVCWALWEDLFTQTTEEYCMLSTVIRFIYTKYWELLYVEHCGKMYLHKIPRSTVCWALWKDLFKKKPGDYFMLNTMGRFIYTKYWGLLYVEHCVKIIYTKYLVIR